jgi:hypothetical protein
MYQFDKRIAMTLDAGRGNKLCFFGNKSKLCSGEARQIIVGC